MSWSLFIYTKRTSTQQQYSVWNLKFCLFISKSSHLRHVEVNCTWQSIFLHRYYWKKLNFELCKHSTQFSLTIVLKSTLPHWIEWVLFMLHSLSAYCVISKKYYKCRVEKYFAGFLTRFLSWYFEEIDINTVFLRCWVLCDDRWMPTSLPEEYSASGSPVTPCNALQQLWSLRLS